MGGTCCSSNAESDPKAMKKRPNTEKERLLQPGQHSKQGSIADIGKPPDDIMDGIDDEDNVSVKTDASFDNESELKLEELIKFFNGLTEEELIKFFDACDSNSEGSINTSEDLNKLLSDVLDDYSSKNNYDIDSNNREYMIKKLNIRLCEALDNYNHEEDLIDKPTFVSKFAQYMEFPHPMKLAEYTIQKRQEEKENVFDTLKYISTGATVVGLKNTSTFNPKESAKQLQNILEGAARGRSDRVIDFLIKFNHKQRREITEKYVSNRGKRLIPHLKSVFNTDMVRVTKEMVRSNGENDAHWLYEAVKTKSSVDYDLLHEVICTKTNSQIQEMLEFYKIRKNHDSVDESIESIINTVKKKKDSYHILVSNILRCLRQEEPPNDVSEKVVIEDAKKLYEYLESKKQANVDGAYSILTTKSWFHIKRVQERYTKASKNSLESIIQKKVSNRIGRCLISILAVSRSRPDYFCQKLVDSMKGLGTNDDLLVRVIVSRSEIDLSHIRHCFDMNYGNGKTLRQWIKDDTSGAYSKFLLAICGFKYKKDDSNELDNLKGNLSSNNSNTSNNSSESKENETLRNDGSGIEGPDVVLMTDGIDLPENADDIEDWDDWLIRGPTITDNSSFDSSLEASKLWNLSKNKKQNKTNFKKELVDLLTTISNKQRQELKQSILDILDNDKKLTLIDLCTNMLGKKGKTLNVMKALLMTPVEYNSQILLNSIKSKDINTLLELILGLTNLKLAKCIEYFKTTYNKNLTQEVEKVLRSKKGATHMIKEILQCKRPETVRVSMNEVNNDVQNLKKKQKDFYMDFYASRSWSHIKKTDQEFGRHSDKNLSTLNKEVLGATSGLMCNIIRSLATQSDNFYSDKLQHAMTGINKNNELLVRIIVSRSEIDLAEIEEIFSNNKIYSHGKSLSQWIKDLFGNSSFTNILIQLCGLASDGHYSDSEISSTGDGDTYSIRSRGFTTTPGRENLQKMVSVNEEETENIDLKENESGGGGSNSVSQNENKENEEYNTNTSISETIDDDSERIVNPAELGNFMLKKMNDKTVDKLWGHLDTDNSGMIETDEILDLLVFTAVLLVAYRARAVGESQPKVDKSRLKNELTPVKDWIVENKVRTKENPNERVITKQQYIHDVGQWLNEYENS